MTDKNKDTKPAEAQEKPLDEIVVELSRPYKTKIGDDEIELTELRFRQPIGNDLKNIESIKGDYERAFKLLARISEDKLSSLDFENLPGRDVNSCTTAVYKATQEENATSHCTTKDCSTTISLTHDFKLRDGRVLRSLNLREPTGRDLKRMDSKNGEYSKLFELLPAICVDQISASDLGRMHGKDVNICNLCVGEVVSPNGA